MTGFGWIRRRQFTAIATAKFEGDPSYQDLPEVAEEVARLAGWLTDKKLGDRRFRWVAEKLAADPSSGQIQAQFRNPAREDRWNRADAAVVYITGHGDLDEEHGPTKHFVVLKETERTRLAATALRTDDLLLWLAGTGIEYLLVIIDVCFAGQVLEEIAGWANDHWLVLASALKDQQAEQGALARAISGYLKTADVYNTNAPYLNVGVFVNALNELLPPDQQVGVIPKEARHKGGTEREPDEGRHICLPNPSYQPRDELVRTDPALQSLALPKDLFRLHNRVSRRMPSADSPGWLLTGRKRLMRDLIRAAAKPGATIVTGSAGCGKSTALARLVTLSDAGFRQRYARELRGVPADLLPPPGVVDVALSARGRSNRQVATQICHDLGIAARAGSWEDPVRANLTALSDYLTRRETPLTLVIDAFDEASDPADLVRSVLGPLGREHPGKLCLIVGVRSPGGDGAPPDEQEGEPQESLTELMAATLRAGRIQVDDDRRWNRQDIVTFVSNILLNTKKSPYRTAGSRVVQRTAEFIAHFAGRSYLMARVAARSAAGRPVMRALDDPEWLDELKGGLLSVFGADLQSSLPSPGELRSGVALLRAVAFARGRGLPRHRIWPKLATAVDAVDSAGSEYGDADVRGLLRSRLNAYLATAEEDGLTVYRLIHDELRDILRYRWRELLTVPAPGGAPDRGHDIPPGAAEGELRAVEARIARALRDWADVEPATAHSQVIPAYVRRHLAEHAVAGSVLDRYVPVAFLPYLDLARLRAAVGASAARQQLERNVPWLQVVRSVTHLWDWNRPERNAGAIELWAALGEIRLPGPVGGWWRVRWAVQPPDLGNVLGHHKEIPRAAAAGELSGGPVAVTAGEDGLLHIWDLSTGSRYRDREPIDTRIGTGDGRGGNTTILSVATARLPNGRLGAVTGSSDGAVRIWDLESGHALGEALGQGGQPIEAVMTTVLPDRRTIVSAADASGVVRSWNLASRAPVGQPVSCGPGMALGLAAAQVGDQVLGLATGRDGGLQAWMLATGARVGERRVGHPLLEQPATGTLPGGRAIAATVLAGRKVAVTGNGDGLLFWDLEEYAALPRRLRGGDGTIRSLAAVQVGSRVMAVTGGNRMVQAWDLAADEPAGELLAGHDGSVEAVAITSSAAGPPGAALAVSASRDKSIRSWEVPRDVLPARGALRSAGIVQAVATVRLPDGQVLAISGDHTDVHLWDLEHGGDLAVLSGHVSPVVGVAAARVPDGVLIVASHWDGWISSWRADGTPVSGAQAGEPSSVAALAMAVLADGRPVAVTGGRGGDVRVWDPVAGEQVGDPLPGHAGVVVAVATATTADGRTLVISAGMDGHVLVRALSAHVSAAAAGHAAAPRPFVDADTGSAIASLAVAAGTDGQPLVFIGGEDGRVRQLDLFAAQEPGQPWQACAGAVAALAAGPLPDGTLALFTGGAESLVQAWNASAGTPAGAPLPVPGPVLALAFQPVPSSLVVGGTGLAVARPLHGD